MPDAPAARRRPTGTLRRGFSVLGVAIRREKAMFAVSTLGAMLFGGLTVADAWVLGWSTDHVVLPAFDSGVTPQGALVTSVALFVGVAVVRGVSIVARRWGAGVMQYRMQAHDRRAVTRQYLALPMRWHQKHPTGELLSNAASDVEAAWGPIAPLPMAVGTAAMIFIAVAQMVLTDAVLALVGLSIFPLVVVANLVFQYYSSPLMTRAQALRAELSEVAHESFDGALVVKSLGREGEETDRFGAKARQLRDVAVRAGRVRAIFDPLMELLPNLGVLAVLLVGVHRVSTGATPPGDVVNIAYLLTVVAFPIRSFGWLLGEFPRSVVGFDRVRAVLAEASGTSYGDQRLRGRGAGTGALLEVDHLAYAHVPGLDVLRDVDFTVPPGRTTAVVGATASGKSTLATLLFRLVDPDRGAVRVDGVDLRELAPGALAEVAALVPQTAFLFDDTVRGNVTLGGDWSDEDVWAALRVAQAEDFVRALPGGLDARLGERGTSLSGGQRQRLSLARALVRSPRLLVMDDATSAVDPEVEARILAALRAGAGGATVVVVAYRKATIGLADEVVFLRDGAVADQGTHAELLRRNPAYADLVNAYEAEAGPDGPDGPDGADATTETAGALR